MIKSPAERPAIYFRQPAEWREWLAAHHAEVVGIWVGLHKRHTGRPSLTWPESVDEALCYGWIDGLRQPVDADRYRIRFTPRRARSIWSRVNLRRVVELRAEGRMQPAGEAAFARLEERRAGIYSYEQRPEVLPEPYAGALAQDPAAARYFATRPAGYRRAAIWWVISAKQEPTRQRRLAQLVADSAAGRLLAQFTR